MTHEEIAEALKAGEEKVVLAYAFNATGKTRLCVAFKDATKEADGTHTGVYFNAYSEDLFVWNNDEENDGLDKRLTILPSSLSVYLTYLTEDNVKDRLAPYKPKYNLRFNWHEDDPSKGIESVSFFIQTQNPNIDQPSIKISRGEERIFVWCFFLALFESAGLGDDQPGHFFIDDPVSSLDDHNIFITAETLFDLIKEHHQKRKIIITTHHIGLFSILSGWFRKADQRETWFPKDKQGEPKENVKICILSSKSGSLTLETDKKDVQLYHLRLLQVLEKARKAEDLRAFHFALLRQALENIASFLGKGHFSYVLSQIDIKDPNGTADIINTRSHMKVYYYQTDLLPSDERDMIVEVLTKIQNKYKFALHA